MKFFSCAALSAALLLMLMTTAFGGEVRLTAADGQILSALVELPDAELDLHVGVILLPMYRSTKVSWQPLVKRLVAAGFTCLALDLRGHGGSRYGADGSDLQKRVTERDPALFNLMYLDVQAADDWLRTNVTGIDWTAVVGASVGCSVAVQALTKGSVKAGAVVLMTPGENYLGVNTMDDIKKWPGASLLILSSEEEKDRGASVIFQQLEGQGAELTLYPQADVHGTNMFGKVPGVENFITDWLKEKFAKSLSVPLINR